MGDVFRANPDELRRIGGNIHDASEGFSKNTQELYDEIGILVNEAYNSPGAIAIAEDIGKYKDELTKMAQVISEYGAYCVKSAATVDRNEQNIADTYKVNTREIM